MIYTFVLINLVACFLKEMDSYKLDTISVKFNKKIMLLENFIFIPLLKARTPEESLMVLFHSLKMTKKEVKGKQKLLELLLAPGILLK